MRRGNPRPPRIPYADFKSGYDFRSVARILREEQLARKQIDPEDRMFVGRRTVLGRLHQLKREEYARYLQGWEAGHMDTPPDPDEDPEGFERWAIQMEGNPAMTLYLINPDGKARGGKRRGKRPNKGGRTMARHRARNSKGQFIKKSSARRRSTTRKRNAPRKRSTAPKTTTRRRSYARRRNPDVFRQLQEGVIDGASVVVGKAAAKMLPTLVPQLPRTGIMGAAVQAGTALIIGWGADQFLSRDTARMIAAGAFAAPMETLAVQLNIPLLGPALAGYGTLGRYAMPGRMGGRIGAYVAPRGALPAPALGSYVQPQAHSNGMMA